eukprot:CAMPEP_0184492820 /NCGR_PEP_ID=MMETSP0113_2-20130426/24345_1 /TAXON_ID=91329 /ORGANISM="Norrisiella sphaerica, Strain BC52" /LENGTH=100 /DNA_ID=CAMNT_0026877819 /DNA_START=475 /DNA_END=774 /DNA_ORIENTATION=-
MASTRKESLKNTPEVPNSPTTRVSAVAGESNAPVSIVVATIVFIALLVTIVICCSCSQNFILAAARTFDARIIDGPCLPLDLAADRAHGEPVAGDVKAKH